MRSQKTWLKDGTVEQDPHHNQREPPTHRVGGSVILREIMGGVQYGQYHMTIILPLIPRLAVVRIIATTATKITEPLILEVGKVHILLEEDPPLGEGLKHPGHSLPTMETFLDCQRKIRQNG